MSELQVSSLFFCLIIGAIGAAVIEGSKKQKTAIAWAVFWAGPPLAILWITAVFGG